MTKTPQIMFRLKPDHYAAVVQAAAEAGNIPPSIFCRSIVLAFLSGDLIEATKNADASFLAAKVANMTEQIEVLMGKFDDLKHESSSTLKEVRDQVVAASGDTYNQTARLFPILAKVEQNTSRISQIGENSEMLLSEFERLINTPEDKTHSPS